MISTPLLRIPGGRLRTAPGWLILLLGLVQCGGEPLIVLDIDPAGLPPAVTKLLLRTQLNADTVQERQLELAQRGIAVHLPTGASGTVQIEVTGLNEGGCKVAQTALTTDVPAGLGRSTRQAVTLTALPTPLCTLTVTIDSGSGRITSSPPLIDCGDTGNPVCKADFPQGTTVPLAAANAATSFLTWSGGCTGLAEGCTVTLDRSTQIHAAFAPRTCSPASWCQQSLLAPGQNLNAIARLDGTSVIAVGDGSAVLRCSGGGCTVLTTGTIESLSAVWVSDPNNVYAVGAGGTVLRCTAATNTCTPLQSGTTRNLSAVWGSDASNVYVVGESGTVLRCAAGSPSCTALNTGKLVPLLAVWGSDAANVYAVGDGGTILRCVVGFPICTVLISTTTQKLRAVAGSAANNVYVVGDGGIAVRCQAGSDSCMPVATNATQGLYALGVSPAGVYTVGTAGRVLRCGSGPTDPCITATSNTTQFLTSVWGSNDGKGYAVGNGGTVLQCMSSPDTCTPMNSGTSAALFAVTGNTNGVYAVGAAGTVLRYQP